MIEYKKISNDEVLKYTNVKTIKISELTNQLNNIKAQNIDVFSLEQYRSTLPENKQGNFMVPPLQDEEELQKLITDLTKLPIQTDISAEK